MQGDYDLVALEGLEFFALHGFHPQEGKTGNRFVVDVQVYTDFEAAGKADDLSKTVDYQVVYQIVKEEMAIPSKLLETVLARIVDRLHSQCREAIKSVEISISKISPALGGPCGCSKVAMRRSFTR